MKSYKIIVTIFFCLLSYVNVFSQCTGNCENGFGKYIFDENSYYEGNWKNGKRHGLGTYIFSNGDKFVGNYVDNIRNGKGIQTSIVGDKIEGVWKDGKFVSGTGKLVYPDGSIYLGGLILHEDTIKPHGKGIKSSTIGSKIDGVWKDGKFVSGNGKLIYTDESIYSNYEGELILHDDTIKPHGKGFAFLKDSKSKTGPDWTYGSPTTVLNNQSRIPRGKWAINLNETGKVFEIKGVITNGVHLLSKDFIFDTGASYVSLPWSTVVELINQKIITSKDFQGDISLQTASGDIMEGKKFIIKEIYFDLVNEKGEIEKVSIYNVDAVVNSSETERIKSALGLSESPTLLGQSALRKFEKFEIDYTQNLLIISK